MWTAVAQDTQMNVEPEYIEQDRKDQQAEKSTHTLHAHTELYRPGHKHTVSSVYYIEF